MKNYGDKGTLSFKLTKNISTFVTTIREYSPNSNHGKNTKTWNNSTKYYKQNNVGSGRDFCIGIIFKQLNHRSIDLSFYLGTVCVLCDNDSDIVSSSSRDCEVLVFDVLSSSETVLSTP